MGGFSTFLQHCQSKWNKCVPPQFQQYGTKKYLLVLNIFKKQPFSVPTKTISYSNTKPSPVQSQTVILATTELSPQGIFLLLDTVISNSPHKLTVYLIQLLNHAVSNIMFLSFYLPSLPKSLSASPQCRPPNTHHTPPGVVNEVVMVSMYKLLPT